MQTIFDPPTSCSIAERPTLLEQLAAEEQKPKDSFLAVRVVLLLAAGFSTFLLPWPVAFFLFIAWILVMAWPRKRK